MSAVTLEDAYATACRLLGEARVEAEMLRAELGRVVGERDEAGRKVVELRAELDATTSSE